MTVETNGRSAMSTGEQSRSMSDHVDLFRSKVLEHLDLSDFGVLDDARRKAKLERLVGRLVSEEGPLLTPNDRAILVERVVEASLGLGVLEPLLADPSVTEIMINGPDDVRVERDGRIIPVASVFTSASQLHRTIDRIVGQVNRRVDEASPMVDCRLPSGERVNVVLPPIALGGPVVTIRRFPKPFTVKELITNDSLDADDANLLAALVRAKTSIVVAGGTGSGKTTLLNALSNFIPSGERIITIEDTAELRLQQSHVVSLESRPANTEGEGEIAIFDLVRNALRMRPDRIIVGEVRGGETLEMLQAMNTGHEGSITTVHANTPIDAMFRLETLAAMNAVRLAPEVLRSQISSAIHVVVQVVRHRSGTRHVAGIAELVSNHRENYEIRPISQTVITDGSVIRTKHTLSTRLLKRVAAAEEQVPSAFVDPGEEADR